MITSTYFFYQEMFKSILGRKVDVSIADSTGKKEGRRLNVYIYFYSKPLKIPLGEGATELKKKT